MKAYPKTTTIALLAWGAAQCSTMVGAQPAEDQTAEDPVIEATQDVVPAKTSSHLKLCAQLGLKVGWTYEFMISGNDESHYWTIRSLGAGGWILVKDSRYAATWLNLSRVIALTPVGIGPVAERPKKPNRLR